MQLGIEFNKHRRREPAARLRSPEMRESVFRGRPSVDEPRQLEFQPPVPQPCNRLDDSQENLFQEPEKLLMFAMLMDAISSFDKLSAVQTMPRRRQWLEARNWLCSNRQDWLFSYRNVCEALGFDPDYLRRGLLSWIQTPRPDIRHGATHCLPLKKAYHSGH